MALKKINKNAQGVPTGEYTDVAGGTLYADVGIGTILPFGGTSDKIPQGYLLCNGTSLLRAFYPELFAVIGTAFGSADSTHFNIPDLRGEFLRGAGTNSHTNQGSGGVVGAHQDSTTVPYMSNRADDNTVVTEQVAPTGGSRANVLNSDSAYKITTNSVYGAYQAPLASTTAAQQLTVRPTNTSVNFIIKAKMIGVPADFMSAVDEAVEESKEIDTIHCPARSDTLLASGIITSGTTSVMLFIPGTFKKDATSVSVSNDMTLALRGDKGYLQTSADVVINDINFNNNFNINMFNVLENGVSIYVAQPSDVAFKNVTNNVPVVAMFLRGSITVS